MWDGLVAIYEAVCLTIWSVLVPACMAPLIVDGYGLRAAADAMLAQPAHTTWHWCPHA